MFKEFDEFKPLDFLSLANELNECSDNFKCSDSSIKRNIYGRIYYSVFLFVREWLKQNTPYASFPFGEHVRMANFIKKHGPFDKTLNIEIYDAMVYLKKLRHQADYYINILIKFSEMYENWVFYDVFQAFEIANFVITCFKEYDKN